MEMQNSYNYFTFDGKIVMFYVLTALNLILIKKYVRILFFIIFSCFFHI